MVVVRTAGGRLLIASRQPLASLRFDLPDLASRLSWGVRLGLQAPSDEDKREIMERRAKGLHIELPEDVLEYLLRHGRRDMASLLEVVEDLKDAAFAAKRKITLPLARDILKSKKNAGPE